VGLGGRLKDDNLFHEKIEAAARFNRESRHILHCVTDVVDFMTKIDMTNLCHVFIYIYKTLYPVLAIVC
jgi:hypothetical protein